MDTKDDDTSEWKESTSDFMTRRSFGLAAIATAALGRRTTLAGLARRKRDPLRLPMMLKQFPAKAMTAFQIGPRVGT
jgi:hypothetical protein